MRNIDEYFEAKAQARVHKTAFYGFLVMTIVLAIGIMR